MLALQISFFWVVSFHIADQVLLFVFLSDRSLIAPSSTKGVHISSVILHHADGFCAHLEAL